MPKKHILVISKSASEAEKISHILNHDSYIAVCCEDITYAEDIDKSNHFSLVIFDFRDGSAAQAEIISKKLQIPLMALCRKGDVLPLNVHMLIKPVKDNRLISEINRLLSTDAEASSDERRFKFGNISFCSFDGTVTKNGKEIELSLRERMLMNYLCLHPNKILSKEEIISAVWKNSSGCSNVSVHILKLRRKLEDNPDKPKYICSIYGKGYILRTK